ncbi:MAG TPA: hypothetical protein DCP11_13465 [Microbacteriaceae bacterium]|nr:hypothetical protein [Microbacteriaceae bacterium]
MRNRHRHDRPQTHDNKEHDEHEHSLVQTSVAANPFVHSALATVNPSSLLEPYAVAMVKDTSTDFITIMKPDRTRHTA